DGGCAGAVELWRNSPSARRAGAARAVGTRGRGRRFLAGQRLVHDRGGDERTIVGSQSQPARGARDNGTVSNRIIGGERVGRLRDRVFDGDRSPSLVDGKPAEHTGALERRHVGAL